MPVLGTVEDFRQDIVFSLSRLRLDGPLSRESRAKSVALQSLTQFWAGGLKGLNGVKSPPIEVLHGEGNQCSLEFLLFPGR